MAISMIQMVKQSKKKKMKNHLKKGSLNMGQAYIYYKKGLAAKNVMQAMCLYKQIGTIIISEVNTLGCALRALSYQIN